MKEQGIFASNRPLRGIGKQKNLNFFQNLLAILEKRRYIKKSSIRLSNNGGLIAQSVEHRPFKAVVPGSSPGQPTIFLIL